MNALKYKISNKKHGNHEEEKRKEKKRLKNMEIMKIEFLHGSMSLAVK